MKKKLIILPLLILTMNSHAQTNSNSPESGENFINAQLMADYLIWGDTRIVAALEGLTEEEFNRPFAELSGNIHSKTAHILSIYEFFLAILEDRAHQGFPSLDHLTKDELIAKWKEVLEIWPKKVSGIQQGFYALPLADNRRVEVQHIYLDTFAHTVLHRGQLLTFIRLLGKSKEDVHPREVNTDYLNYVFSVKPEWVYPSLK